MQIVSIDQNKPLSISLKGNDPDKDDKISYLIVTNPSLGTIAGFDKTSGYLTYMPTSGFNGQDRLNFKVVDSHGAESNNGLIVIRANATSSSPSSLPSVPSSESSSPPRLPSSPSLSPPIANENTTTPTTATNENNTVATGASLTHRTSPSTVATNASTVARNASAAATADNQTAAAATSNLTSSGNKTLSSFATSALAATDQYNFLLKWGGPGILSVTSATLMILL